MASIFDELPDAAPEGSIFDTLPDENPRRKQIMEGTRKALELGASSPALERMKDSSMMGLRRPMTAGMSALSGEIGEWFGGEPASFGERYGASEEAYDQFMKEQEDKAGWTGTAASLVGGLAAGGPLRGAMPSLGASIGSSAAMGGVEGFLRGEGDFTDRLKSGAIGAGTGAAVSGLVGGIGAVRNNIAANRAEREAIEELPDQLRGRARDLYGQLEAGGVTYSPEQMREFERNALAQVRAEGFDPLSTAHEPVTDMMNRIGRMTDAGQNGAMPLQQLQNLRTDILGIAGADNPQARRFSGPILDELDQFVGGTQPQQGTLSPDEIATMWPEARGLWRQQANLEDVLHAADKAELRAASTYSGGNTENAVRQNIRGMYERATKPGTRSKFSPDELEAMRLTVEGTPTENALRGVGRAFGATGWGGPTSVGSNAFVGTLLGLDPVSAGLVSGGLYGAGRVARRAGSELAQGNINNLMRLIGTGSEAPLVQRGPTREALAAMLAGRAGGQAQR